jgi:AdoMet-dependent rRNA methyltransferase SPB1
MQLNMKAPMDIGLERQDGLGDDSMFDLGMVDGKFARSENDMDNRGEDEDEDEEDEEDEGTDDEDRRRLDELEINLDQLYDEFQNRRLEKDAKAKVKAARARRAAEEGEWQGIQENEESEEDSNSDVAPVEEESSSESEDDDGEERTGGLLTDLKGPKDLSKDREAALWFDQPVFKGVQGLEDLLEDEDELEEDEDEDEDEEDELEEDVDARTAGTTPTELGISDDEDEVSRGFRRGPEVYTVVDIDTYQTSETGQRTKRKRDSTIWDDSPEPEDRKRRREGDFGSAPIC